jgi:hypothetical protein
MNSCTLMVFIFVELRWRLSRGRGLSSDAPNRLKYWFSAPKFIRLRSTYPLVTLKKSRIAHFIMPKILRRVITGSISAVSKLFIYLLLDEISHWAVLKSRVCMRSRSATLGQLASWGTDAKSVRRSWAAGVEVQSTRPSGSNRIWV